MSFRIPFHFLMMILLMLCACETDPADDDDDTAADDDDDGEPVEWLDFEDESPWYQCTDDEIPEEATVVTAFDAADQYFGDENLRTVQATVGFPEETNWSQVGLRFLLECPDGGTCDHWDRWGNVQLVLNPQEDAENWEYMELARHITPYRMGMCEYIDVTPVASQLVGQQTLTSFIDTWVGPGHSDGDGWEVTVEFVFYPGPRGGADQVVNIWGARQIIVGETEEDANVDSQIDPVTVPVPADATQVIAHLTTTGHSFGNSGNCAEFCEMRQDVIVNGEIFSVEPWRDDCEDNPVSPQMGTWEYDRNGWCPGAIVVGQQIDITEAIVAGEDNIIDFDILLSTGVEYNNYTPVDLLPNEVVALRVYIYQ